MEQLSFLIVTTNNLPEAYFLAQFLIGKKQRVAIMNITGRTVAENVRVLRRIRKNRGLPYLSDLLLGKLVRRWYQLPSVVPFPELTGSVLESIRQQVTYYESRDPHDRSSLGFVRDFAPAYILIAGAPVLKQSVLGLARNGALNRHLGLSPHYRGSDCPLWGLYENDMHNIGFTIHFVTEKVDGGDIALQERVPADASLDFSEYIARIQLVASEGFTSVLEKIISGSPLPRHVQKKGGKHYPPAGLRIIRRAYENYAKYLSNPGQQQAVSGR